MSGILLQFEGLSPSLGPYPDGTVIFESDTPGPWQFTLPNIAFFTIKGTAGGGLGTVEGTGKTIVPGPGGGGGGEFETHNAATQGAVIGGLVGAGAYQGAAGPVAGTKTTLNANAGLSLSAATANPGGNGVYPGSPGAGGTASGGSVSNTSGHNGGRTNLWDGGGGAPALVDQTTAGGPAIAPGGGSPGGVYVAGNTSPGAPGRIQIIARTS